MTRFVPKMARGILPMALLLAAWGGAAPAAATVPITLVPLAVDAPESPVQPGVTPACTTPAPVHKYAGYHCYRPDQIAAAYGVDKIHALGDYGQGQTIVLVDSYGSPTAANDINVFYQTFFKGQPMANGQPFPAPNFNEVYPNGQQTFTCTKSRGLSGPCSAAGWSVEATLDIEWAYAIAPLAHIILLATPPAETLGVPGLPNMFKGIRDEIDANPAGTIFSQSFGLAENTFGGNALNQINAFDETYAYGINTKHDSFLASSGDQGNGGNDKNHKLSGVYGFNVVGFPAASPLVTAVGGTQLMYGWTWAPTVTGPAFNPDGSQNLAYFNWTDGGMTEALWNECGTFGGGNCVTGGGTSNFLAAPSFQSQIPSSVNKGMRSIPDLSWNAAVNGGVLIYLSQYPTAIRTGWHIEGGTSAASPQMAGVIALVNEMRQANGKAPIGNVDQAIYDLGHQDAVSGPDSSFDGSANPSSFYRDIVSQTFGSAQITLDNNAWPPAGPGVPPYFATPGYDLTTGFGTPRADRFVLALANS